MFENRISPLASNLCSQKQPFAAIPILRRSVKPIRFYFFLSCIDFSDEKCTIRVREKILLVAYNILWILNLASKISCFRVSFVDVNSFSLISKFLSYILWCIVYRRKAFLKHFLDEVCDLTQLIRLKDKNRLAVGLKASIALLMAAIFVKSTYTAIRILIGVRLDAIYNKRDTCRIFQIHLHSRSEKAIAKFITRLLDHYVDWNIQFAVAVMYCFCCSEIERAICNLCNQQQWFLSQDIWQRYYTIRKCVQVLEERFSLPIFIFCMRSFVEFFRLLSHSLDRARTKGLTKFSVQSGMYSLVILVVFVVVIVRANSLMESYKKLCRKMIAVSEDVLYQNDDFEMNRRWILMMDDKCNIGLSAWGMFYLKKKLFITAVASVVSYGVILYQFRGLQ
ncbi:uncharacterized protein TNCT_191701 [Trichonephila clavata]|uniref:Gustatory receptor n=1 Tax=Trichonephila clavata TaxID=2740835 RepID=A0A8X6GVI0_TRICU|nr:uncharacterized protein TNCT_191701 [Trichonephila clavata]